MDAQVDPSIVTIPPLEMGGEALRSIPQGARPANETEGLIATLKPETTKAVLLTAGGYDMNTPEWLKPGLYGAAIGAILVVGVGFAWGGWMTGATARERAMTLADDEVVAALVPVCLDMALADPDRATHLATIRAATNFRQRDALMDTGWATMPGSADPDRVIAKACLERLDLDAS